MEKTGGKMVEQIIRPTGLLDPLVELRPTENQIDDLIEEIYKTTEKGDRTLVTTLTKKIGRRFDHIFNRKWYQGKISALRYKNNRKI